MWKFGCIFKNIIKNVHNQRIVVLGYCSLMFLEGHQIYDKELGICLIRGKWAPVPVIVHIIQLLALLLAATTLLCP